jgi:hypothetical protein
LVLLIEKSISAKALMLFSAALRHMERKKGATVLRL